MATLLISGSVYTAGLSRDEPELVKSAVPTTTTTSTSTTLAPTTTAAPSTTAPAPAPRAPAPKPPPPPAPRPSGVAAYSGRGAWVDVYDWSNAFTKGNPGVRPAQIDDMANRGVKTLYLQVSKHESADDIMEPELLMPLIDRARARGMAVVGWYLPTLEDPGRDARRMIALTRLPLAGFAVDIESTKVGDAAERSRRLVQVSSSLRAAAPSVALGAIVMSPVATEVINPRFWPGFPYREIAPLYDVWMTMGYWSYRTEASGYRDAHRYTHESVTRLRTLVGRPDLPVHPIGDAGCAPNSTVTGAEVAAYSRAVAEVGGLGASLYDYRLMREEHWQTLS